MKQTHQNCSFPFAKSEMENVVITELTQGKEFANELRKKLHPNINTPRKACTFLLEKIMSNYDNALASLSLIENEESSFNSKRKGSLVNNHVAKKRKLLPKKRSEQVYCRTGFDQVGGDGYNWRKYGQKPILGTNNPRSYYRCTHRRSRGCLATKQVQRTEEDSSMFDIIYQGKHTCIQEMTKQCKGHYDMLKKEEMMMMMIRNEQCLKVENQELSSNAENVTPFSLPSTPIESEITEPLIFSSPTNFGETSYLPPFSSPATSESYFSAPFQANGFGFAPNFQDVPEFDLAEIMSNPTPFTDFQFEDVDFSNNQVGFDFLDVTDFQLEDVDFSNNQVSFDFLEDFDCFS